jgi:hypothetical protein
VESVQRGEKDVARARKNEAYALAVCCHDMMCDVAAIIEMWRCGGVENLRNLWVRITVNEIERSFCRTEV